MGQMLQSLIPCVKGKRNKNLLSQNQEINLERAPKHNFSQNHLPIDNKYVKTDLKIEDLDLDNYNFISNGAFGDVLQVSLKSDKERKFAIKIMNINSSKTELIEEINNELIILEKLSNESIKPRCFPKYYGYFTQENLANQTIFYICFDFLPYTLNSIIDINQNLKISNDVFYRLFKILIHGLSFLQILGISHRDLKPGNILLDETKKNPTIIDFGVSKNISQQHQMILKTKMNVTVQGTKTYMSPEFVEAWDNNEEEININPYKSDAFSFGLIFSNILKPKLIRNDMNQKEIDQNLNQLQTKMNQMSTLEDQQKFEKMWISFKNCLRIDPTERWDFIKVFKEIIDLEDKRKFRFHIMVEQADEVEGLDGLFIKIQESQVQKNESLFSIQTTNYDSFLKNDLILEDLEYGDTINEGGFGRIIQVTHKKTKELYAIKLLVLRMDTEQELIVKNEIKCFEKLSKIMIHKPKFCTEYYGYVKEKAVMGQITYHILFKYYPYDLRKVIEEGSICNDFEKIKLFFYKLIQGLAFLQSCKIAHRDIKPENLLLDQNKTEIFLGDFGVAMKYQENDKSLYSYCGTPEYRSPEWMQAQINKRSNINVNFFKSDSFALGLVVLEMGGIKNNLKKNKNYDSYIMELESMIIQFQLKFQFDIKKNEENKRFIKDLQSILRDNPDVRNDCCCLFLNNLKLENLNKLKYHIYIQDQSFDELQTKKQKQKDDKKVNIAHSTHFDINKEIAGLDAQGVFQLAILCQEGIACEKNPKKAFELYQKSSSMGFEKAMINLALCYVYGDGCERNEKMGFEFYEKAANLGDAQAIFSLGLCYEKGLGCDVNYKTAVQLYEKSANLQFPKAMINLGLCCLTGKGCQQNLQKGFEYFKQGADLKDKEAIFNLGICYEKGMGCEQNQLKAIELYQNAASLGYTSAMINLGLCFMNGNGIELNLFEAFKLFEKAANLGDAKGIFSLSICYEKGLGCQMNEKKAFELLNESANMGNTRSMINLALCFIRGKGCEQDVISGFEWFQKAASLGDKEAMVNLSVCFRDGLGCEKNEEKAIEYFQKGND